MKRDARSAELLLPFLRGENIKRWRIESEDLFLINIPRGKVRIDDYPAIRDHLLPFKDKLEARATKQVWFELQQAQLAYQPIMKKRKLIWPHFQASASFCMDDTGVYLNNKAFFISDPPFEELGFLNSKCGWFLLAHLARIKRGGYLEAEAQYVEQLPSITGENAEAASIRDVAVSTNSKAILKPSG